MKLKNLLLAGFAVGALLFAILYGRELSRPSPPPPEPVVVTNDPRVAALELRLSEQQRELKQLHDLLAAERARSVEPAKKDAPVRFAAESAPVATNAANPFGQILQAVSSVLTNPAAVKSITDRFGNAMRVRQRLYADFIKQAGLNEQQAREFNRLVRLKRQAQLGARWMGADEARRQVEEADQGLQKLLGNSYQDYAAYENQMPARYFVESFDLQMADRGAPLSAESKSRLIDAIALVPGMMNDERGGAATPAEGAPGQPATIEQALEKDLDRTMERYDQIVAAAQPVLTPAENKALDEYLGQQVQDREMGANVAKAVLPALFGTNGIPGGRIGLPGGSNSGTREGGTAAPGTLP